MVECGMRTGVERPKKGEARGKPGLVLNHRCFFTLLRGGGKGENGACDLGPRIWESGLDVPGMVAIFLKSLTVFAAGRLEAACVFSLRAPIRRALDRSGRGWYRRTRFMGGVQAVRNG